jgi:hypothetical protein
LILQDLINEREGEVKERVSTYSIETGISIHGGPAARAALAFSRRLSTRRSVHSRFCLIVRRHTDGDRE